MLAAIKQPERERERASDLSCVCGQHEFEIHSPQLFGGEISESLQSQTTQKQSCWNRKQVAAACCDYSRPQPQYKSESESESESESKSSRHRPETRGKCAAFCGSGRRRDVAGILRKSLRNICASPLLPSPSLTMANILGFETI